MPNGLAQVQIVMVTLVKLLPKRSALQQRLPPQQPLPLQRPADQLRLNILNMDISIERTLQIQIPLLRIGMLKSLPIHTITRFAYILKTLFWEIPGLELKDTPRTVHGTLIPR